MKDDRTCRSEQYWDDDLERSGGQARPFCVSGAEPLLHEAIDLAVSAGACRLAGRLNPDSRAVWHAVAEAKRRDAITKLADYLRERGGRHRAP